MLKLLLVYAIIGLHGATSNNSETEFALCSMHGCIQSNSSTTFAEYCRSRSAVLVERCCFQADNDTSHGRAILGLDLHGCHLTTFDVLQANYSGTAVEYNRSVIEILTLEDNPAEHCPEKDFDEMIQLQYLSLPQSCACPGGNESWLHTQVSNDSRICTQQVNICTAYNVTCPNFSHCVMHAPGVTWCECDVGHYGYKCLRQGTFALSGFVAGILCSVVFLSVFLWLLIRRKAQKID